MSIAYPSPFPYVWLLIVSIVILSVCFYKFPTLRGYRRKRNVVIYALVALLLTLTAYQAYDASLGPAIASYSLSDDGIKFYAGKINQLTVSCSNLGIRATDFYLILKSINASFTVDSQQNYVQTNSTMIKIPFNFEAFNVHASETKTVNFTIDADVTSFEFYPYIEPDEGPIFTGSTYKAQGTLNNTTNLYMFYAEPGPCV